MNIGEFEFASATMRSPEISNSHFGCKKTKTLKNTRFLCVFVFFKLRPLFKRGVYFTRDIIYMYIYKKIDGIIFAK